MTGVCQQAQQVKILFERGADILGTIEVHAQRYHSCHVIVKTEGKSVPEEVLQFAADVCAKYSDSRGDRVPVDCCRVKFVKKPKGAKAGFVTYSAFTTLAGFPQNVQTGCEKPS